MSAVVQIKGPGFKDGDGDGEGESRAYVHIEVERVLNGWIMTSTDDDNNEYKEVFSIDDAPKLLECFNEAIMSEFNDE